MRMEGEHRRLAVRAMGRVHSGLDHRAVSKMNAVENTNRQMQWPIRKSGNVEAVELQRRVHRQVTLFVIPRQVHGDARKLPHADDVEHFSRIQNPIWIQRFFHGAHGFDFRRSMLNAQERTLRQPNAVFA